MSDIPAPCAGVVLAAGSDSRFGEPKAPLEVDGERLVDRSVRVLREGGCDPIFVILGAWEGSVDDALVIVNHGWEEGMGQVELQLTQHDLFWLRFLRVVITEER